MPLGVQPLTDVILSKGIVEWKNHADQVLQQWQQAAIPDDVPPLLAQRNAHPRDAFIRFEEDDHRYLIQWQPGSSSSWGQFQSTALVSSTKLGGQYFDDFDDKRVIARMMGRDDWSDNKYFGMTADHIRRWWRYHGSVMSWSGNQMHLCCEHFYNDNPQLHVRDYPEMVRFQAFLRDHPLVPFRTEMRVFTSGQFCVSGSVDMLFVNKLVRMGTTNGRPWYVLHLLMYDWKRCKKFAKWGYSRGKGIMSHLDKCEWIKYSVQLYTYKFILEHFYGQFEWRGRFIQRIVVDDLYLVVMHPNQPSYLCEQAKDVSSEVLQMMQNRQEQVRQSHPELVDQDPTQQFYK